MASSVTATITLDTRPIAILAGNVAMRVWADLSVAPDGTSVWVYPVPGGPAKYEISENPSRPGSIMDAPADEYESREDLRDRLLLRARGCAICHRGVPEHSDRMRERAAILGRRQACAEFTFGASS